jgi:hypothetical protein
MPSMVTVPSKTQVASGLAFSLARTSVANYAYALEAEGRGRLRREGPGARYAMPVQGSVGAAGPF